MRLLLPGSLARPVPSSRVQIDITAQSSGIRSLAWSLGSCSSLPTIGWARRRRRLELRWVFRGQDGGAPGTERRSRAACEWGPRPRPWWWSAQQRLGESEPSTIWHRGRCEWRGAGERLAGGPWLAAKRRVPGGDTWTPQEREEAFGSRCRVAARDWLDRVGLGRLLGDVLAEAGSLWPLLRNGGGAEPGVGNLAHVYGGDQPFRLKSNRVRPSSKDAESRVPLAPRRSAFSEPRGVGGVIFPGELVCFPSPSRRPRHPRGLGRGRGGRGSTWGRGGDVHVAPAPGYPAPGFGAGAALPGTGCVSAGPAISDRRWGPLTGKEGWDCWNQLCSEP